MLFNKRCNKRKPLVTKGKSKHACVATSVRYFNPLTFNLVSVASKQKRKIAVAVKRANRTARKNGTRVIVWY